MAKGDLTDVEWARLEPLLPSSRGEPGGRFRDHRQVINGILWRIRDGAIWSQIPERYGPHQTCYDRFARWDEDGTWDRVEKAPQTDADAAGELDWKVQVDSTIVRAHQHAAGARKRGCRAQSLAMCGPWVGPEVA